MDPVWLYSLGSVFLVSVLSLIGIAGLSMRADRLRRVTSAAVALAVGAMLGDAFIHLLPEAFEASGGSLATSLYVLGGLFLFFILEKSLYWRHAHRPDAIQTFGYMDLIGDGIHNLIDGALIAAAYLVDRTAGIATTTAVLLHEIPQEIGDFGVLVRAGFSTRAALWLNFLSALVSMIGAVVVLVLGQRLAGFAASMGPLVAGAFIYIAASDLVPELHKERGVQRTILQLLGMTTGVCLMLLLRLLKGH